MEQAQGWDPVRALGAIEERQAPWRRFGHIPSLGAREDYKRGGLRLVRMLRGRRSPKQITITQSKTRSIISSL